MARVVMLTAMAGDGIDLQCGDPFETDDATAARLIECGAAVAEMDAPTVQKPVKKQAEPKVVAPEDPDEDGEESESDADETVVEQPARRVTRRR